MAAAHEDEWTDAADWPDAQVAPMDCASAEWPGKRGPEVIARRVGYVAAELPADPRSRRSRTVGKGQRSLDGIEDGAYAYSFIATNEDLEPDVGIAGSE